MAINYGKGKNDSDYDLGEMHKLLVTTVYVEHCFWAAIVAL